MHEKTINNQSKIRKLSSIISLIFVVNAQTLTISSDYTFEDFTPKEPSDYFPTFFTKIATGIYQFTGNRIEITNGARLEFDDIQIRFPNHASITVNIGTELFIDESLLTTINTGQVDYWQGIKVFGSPTQPQYDFLPFPFDQLGHYNGILNAADFGMVITTSTTTIENAAIGTESINGGIIQSYGSTYKNCGNAIRIHEYDYNYSVSSIPPGFNEKINACLFENSKFRMVNTRDYSTANDHFGSPLSFQLVYLDRVGTINFYGCVFENTRTAPICFERGIGITAISSSIKLQNDGNGTIDPISGCISYDGVNKNIFQQLYTAIWGYYHTNPLEEFIIGVEDAEFINCWQSMNLLGGKGHIITNTITAQNTMGLYFDYGVSACQDFLDIFSFKETNALIFNENIIQLNDFVNDEDVKMLFIEDSKLFPMLVYKNLFINGNTVIDRPKTFVYTNDIVGTWLQGDNPKVDIQCNNYNNVHYDWVLLNTVPGQFPLSSTTMAAGNVFSINSEIMNLQTNHVEYTHKPFTLNETPVPVFPFPNPNPNGFIFTPNPAIEENLCPSIDCKQWPLMLEKLGRQSLHTPYQLYPNPANQSITLELLVDHFDSEHLSLAVIDAQGKTFQIPFSAQAQKLQLDISSLAPGAYSIKLIGQNVAVFAKFVKTQ